MAIKRREGGFTLLEMVIALVVLALLGAAAGYGLVGGTLAFTGTADAVQTLGKLRYASERMAREIRETRRNPASPAVYDITTMNATTLAFTKSDGVTVTLSGTPPLVTLAYSTPSGAHTLTDEVGTLAFSYLQSDGVTAASGNGDVAFVELELVLTRSGNSYPQRTRISLRNQQ